MTELRAFHNDPAIKEKYIARVKAHQVADEIIKGKYWGNGKGCAVGCTLHGNDHKAYETELGIPTSIAKLKDTLFEGMPDVDAKTFPLRFLDVIPVGADTSLVIPKFLHWLFVDEEHGVINFTKDEGVRIAIKNVAELLHKQIKGEDVTKEQWLDAGEDATTAAADYAAVAGYAVAKATTAAAWAAACAADATAWAVAKATTAAAWAAAYAAANAADYSYAATNAAKADAATNAAYAAYSAAHAAKAYAAANATVWKTAREKHILKQVGKLLELLNNLKLT